MVLRSNNKTNLGDVKQAVPSQLSVASPELPQCRGPTLITLGHCNKKKEDHYNNYIKKKGNMTE